MDIRIALMIDNPARFFHSQIHLTELSAAHVHKQLRKNPQTGVGPEL
jgi:hypothetical protein